MKRIVAFVLLLSLCFSVLPLAEAAENTSLLTEEEFEVLKITNQEREKEGLAPLTSLPELQKATDIRAMEIVELFSHTRPDNNPWYTVFSQVTLPTYRTAGENIAAGYANPEAAMVGWMNSDGHRANILNAGYTHIGVGHYYLKESDYRNHWVQVFFTGWDCTYTAMTVSRREEGTVPMGTSVEDLGLVACLQCEGCGASWLPVLESYCTGYDPNRPGVQTLTVSCLGQTATVDVTVEAPTVDGEIKILHSLELASDISVNYAVKEETLAKYDTFYLECSLPSYEGGGQSGIKTLTLQPTLKDGYYYFTLSDLTAVQMTDQLLTTLHMEKDGDYYVSPADSYSISAYAYNQLGKAAASEKLKSLCADLLAYGAAAQTFKGYNTEHPADGDLTEELRAYCTDLSSVTFGNHNAVLDDVEDPVITWEGKSLDLGSRVTLKFVFNGAGYTGDPTALTLRIMYVNQEGTHCSYFIRGAQPYGKENCYAFSFDGLLASELRSVLSVCVMNGADQLSPTLRYSVDSYGNGRTGTLLTLCQALIAYSDSAKAFFAS